MRQSRGHKERDTHNEMNRQRPIVDRHTYTCVRIFAVFLDIVGERERKSSVRDLRHEEVYRMSGENQERRVVSTHEGCESRCVSIVAVVPIIRTSGRKTNCRYTVAKEANDEMWT